METASRLKKPVIAAVKQAAKRMTKRPFTVAQKDSASNLVTSADLAVQAFLRERLCRLLPGSGFFGEEGDAAGADTPYLWVVDPIDGTCNFSRGIEECAISVALLKDNRAVLGVVYNPFRDHLFSAVKGQGACLNGKPIHVSNATFEEGLLCTAMSLYRKDLADTCLDIIADAYEQCNDVRRFGAAALELCYLAAGLCDLYFEIRIFPWDYAAASLVLSEAGGILRGYDGEELTFDRATPLIGANSMENHERLNAIVKAHMPIMPYEEILR